MLLVLVGLGYWAHVSLAGWDLQTTHPRRARVVFWVAIVGGAALLFRAALGIVDGNLSAREMIGTTPAALGLGTLLALYSFRFRPARQPTSGPGQTSIAISTVAWVIGWCFVIASLFWLVNSFASAYGRGIGQDVQKGLIDQPEVILHAHGWSWRRRDWIPRAFFAKARSTPRITRTGTSTYVSSPHRETPTFSFR